MSADRLTNPPILIMNKTKPWLLWSGVCASSEGGHQKNGESDSWSSSWSGPLIRSEWQENMGPHRYLPPVTAPSPAAPIWPLTSPSLTTLSIPCWLLRTLLRSWKWALLSVTFISIKRLCLSLQSYMSILVFIVWPSPLIGHTLFVCPSQVGALLQDAINPLGVSSQWPLESWGFLQLLAQWTLVQHL